MLKYIIAPLIMACAASIAIADISIFKLSLGGGLDDLQSQLIEENFIFTSITDEKIEARKLAKNELDNKQYKNYQEFFPSTELTALACNGKVKRIEYKTVFQEKTYDLMLARKEVFKYLKDNGAQLQDIVLHQDEANVRVVEKFVVDRNSIQGAAVKGEEIVSVSIELMPEDPKRKKLKLMVRMENNWFCPQ